MSVQRVSLVLRDNEFAGLLSLSRMEERPVDYQLRFMLRKELKERGLLAADDSHPALPGQTLQEASS